MSPPANIIRLRLTLTHVTFDLDPMTMAIRASKDYKIRQKVTFYDHCNCYYMCFCNQKIGCKVEALVSHEAEAEAFENHEAEAEARLSKI